MNGHFLVVKKIIRTESQVKEVLLVPIFKGDFITLCIIKVIYKEKIKIVARKVLGHAFYFYGNIISLIITLMNFCLFLQSKTSVTTYEGFRVFLEGTKAVFGKKDGWY